MSERRSPEETRQLVLHDTTDVVGQCRDFTRRALTEWQWLPGGGGGSGHEEESDHGALPAEDALLLVSEVVANACMHAGGPKSLLLHCTPERLRIEVIDGSPVAPTVRTHVDPGLPGGHGLLIVERLARQWGYEPVDAGKRVWVEVDAPPDIGHRQDGEAVERWLDRFPRSA
ncbi:ATP-binding protein [Streptomyces sp. ISL-66]|uniref:ATP-binding protein n=1 Tax=Streptomyces sp. ISL-66 TaxID=2819186 RepID=UPI002035E383|nr:ATP-binding protein [Streptomyces sp. ISL-66]